MRSGLILGIESSCDETGAAVLRNGSDVLSNIVASQISLHAAYGGVVPELASREHLRNIVPVVRQAVAEAGINLADLDAIAVTEGPGLTGALLVGILYAKGLAFALNKPLIAVNHLEGHIHAVVMEAKLNQFPILALVVSGGHTHLYLASQTDGVWRYQNVGRTVDDAAGEAFDKVAKLLGLGYPGGPQIDALAPLGNPNAVPFTFNSIRSKSGILGSPGLASETWDTTARFDFSFSGIKTAVLRYTQTHGMSASIEARRGNPEIRPDAETLDLIASFQSAVVGNLIRQTLAAAEAFDARALLVSGGVAANRELRRRFTSAAAERNLPIAFPSLALATDNAAMIAAAAWPRFLTQTHAPESLTAAPQLKLGQQSVS
jgi:N6-L-threonylcarbamoyladenine synthase